MSRILTAGFIILYLAIQVIVPIVLLHKRGGFLPFDWSTPGIGKRFSWQMYGSSHYDYSFAVKTPGKKRAKKIKLKDYVTTFESRIQYGRYIPDKICAANSSFVAVVRTRRKTRKEFTCSNNS